MAASRPTLTPGQKQVLRLLQRLPAGITMADLAERLDITLYAAGKALKELADVHKLVVRATLGSGALWATKEHGAAIVEKRRADRAAYEASRAAHRMRQAERARVRHDEALTKAAAAEIEEAANNAFIRPPIHRWVPAGQWGAVELAGVPSVFHLGVHQ